MFPSRRRRHISDRPANSQRQEVCLTSADDSEFTKTDKGDKLAPKLLVIPDHSSLSFCLRAGNQPGGVAFLGTGRKN